MGLECKFDGDLLNQGTILFTSKNGSKVLYVFRGFKDHKEVQAHFELQEEEIYGGAFYEIVDCVFEFVPKSGSFGAIPPQIAEDVASIIYKKLREEGVEVDKKNVVILKRPKYKKDWSKIKED